MISALEPCMFVRPPDASVDKLLSKVVGLRRPPHRLYLRPHETAERVRRLLPAEVFSGYRKIAFVRNPYSWLVSFYEVRRRGPRHRHHERVARMRGFGEYVDWQITRHDRFLHRYVAGSNGELLIDYLGRFERLEEDSRRIFELIGVHRGPLPHDNRATGRDYRDYYDDETRKKVACHWAADLELFGYGFDGMIEDRLAPPRVDSSEPAGRTCDGPERPPAKAFSGLSGRG